MLRSVLILVSLLFCSVASSNEGATNGASAGVSSEAGVGEGQEASTPCEASGGSAANNAAGKHDKNFAEADKLQLDFIATPLGDFVEFMAHATQRNFIISAPLEGEVRIISNKPVDKQTAWEMFVSVLEQKGYKITKLNKQKDYIYKIEKSASY